MSQIWQKYKLRIVRRHLLWRAVRARHVMTAVNDQTHLISEQTILGVCVVRNEIARLPHFLDYHRALGVEHFLFVDNASDDGTRELLAGQPDVSLWETEASYKKARFGLDWSTWLQIKHASGHWCLTLDADELLVFPNMEQQKLRDLCRFLDETNQTAFGALMLDLYPKGRISDGCFASGDDPLALLEYFDAAPYRATRQLPKQNLWVQGGVRERAFFADDPKRGPTLNKLPLVKWHWRYVYVNSTHALLPSRLNFEYEGPGDKRACGVLLHTKFLPFAGEKSQEEKLRKQHFGDPDAFQDYHDAVMDAPTLWTSDSVRFRDWRQLEILGLMSRGKWRVQR